MRCSKPFETIPEWKVVEIQGELNLREDKDAKKDENKPNVRALETDHLKILTRKDLAGRNSETFISTNLERRF